MDAQEKSKIISEAYDNYAEIIESLKFIEHNDNSYGPLGSDGLSIFRPHNITKIVDDIFHHDWSNSELDEYRHIMDICKEELMTDVLFGFKWCGDEHVGYILKTFKRAEQLILSSGRPSKNKTYAETYVLVAAYNFYSGNIDVILMRGSEINCLTPLVIVKTPEEFYNDYLKYSKQLEDERRSQPMIITVGMWEDVLAQIKKLYDKIEAHEEDVRNNYERRYNSEEE